MSHEIRTPLNAIVGFSNLLTTEKNISEEEKKEFASIIDNNTRLLLKLVNDVLELSRIESGNMSFHCEDCSAHHFAETVYQTHQVIILPPVEFIKEFPDEDVTIHIDRMRLTQVITNFLGNAKKFTSQGHIKLGYFCDKEKKEIHFFVEDTGAGIPKEELQMIFERFYKRNEFVQGVGLGLAISKVIVEKMNGHIDVQSEVNKGCAGCLGRANCKTRYASTPASTVPSMTPIFACVSNTGESPKERLAMNKETVKPIPPKRQIPVRFTQVMPFSSPANPIFITSQVKK